MNALAEHDLYWIEEPTSPDDVLGHAAIRAAVAPIGVATGEHGMNRVLFRQVSIKAPRTWHCSPRPCGGTCRSGSGIAVIAPNWRQQS